MTRRALAEMRKESASFLKKRSKKLLLIGPQARPPARSGTKSFLVTFFQKSNFFLPASLTAFAPAGARGRAILAGAASALAARALAAMTAFAAVPLTLSYLGPERYGAWLAMVSLLAWLSLTDLGLGSGFANAVTEAFARNRPDLIRRHVANGLILTAGIAKAAIIAAILLVPAVNWAGLLGLGTPTGRAEVPAAITVAVVIFLAGMPLAMAPRLLTACGEGHLANAWAAAGNLLALLALFLVTCRPGPMLRLVIAVAGARLLVAAACLAWLLIIHRPALRPRRADLRPAAMPVLLRAGGQFFIIQILALIVFETDALIAGHYRGAASIPAYSLAYGLFAYTGLPQSLAFSYLWTAYADAMARRDIAWLQAMFRWTFFAGMAFTSVTALVLIPVAAPFIHWWTRGAVTPGRTLILWLAGWSVVHAATNPHACLLAAASRLRAQIIYSAAAAVCNVALSIDLVERYGLSGLIAATVISYAVFICIPIQIDTRRLLNTLRAGC
jgi:O-antigen/teichoic acid export membrane protein